MNDEGYPPCPYCGNELHLDPQARAKCKSCEQWVHPGRDQRVFDHHPLTEEENDTVQQLKSATRNFAVSWGDIEKMRDQLAEKFGGEPNPGDLLWAVWNDLLTRQPDRAPEIRLEMARQRHREGDDPTQLLDQLRDEADRMGGVEPWIWRQVARFKSEIGFDPTPELERENRRQLEQHREYGATKVSITTVGNGCRSCQQLDGRTFAVDEALREMPLPNPDCTHAPEEGAEPVCRCSWQPEEIDHSGTYQVEAGGGQKSGCLVALATLPANLIAELLPG